MKTLKITILIIIMIVFATSCIKRNNCDCGKEGKFVYFKEPLQIEPAPHGNPDVNAIFYHEGNLDSFYYIQDYIPIKFRTNDTINVSICLEKKNRCGMLDMHFCPYKIKCIEKIE